jgi:hypothetical protein
MLVDTGPPVQVLEGELHGHLGKGGGLHDVVPGTAAVFTGDNSVHLVLGTTLGVAISACVGVLLVLFWLVFFCATRAADAASRSKYGRGRVKEEHEYVHHRDLRARSWANKPRRQNAQCIQPTSYALSMHSSFETANSHRDDIIECEDSEPWVSQSCFETCFGCGQVDDNVSTKAETGTFMQDTYVSLISGSSYGSYQAVESRRQPQVITTEPRSTCLGAVLKMCMCQCPRRGNGFRDLRERYDDYEDMA